MRVLIMFRDGQLLAISEELQDVVMAVNVCFECKNEVLGEIPEEKFKVLTPHQRMQFLIKVGKEGLS